MRLVGKISDARKAHIFLSYLKSRGCDVSLEKQADPEVVYIVWIYNEDEYEAAREMFNEFIADSDNPEYAKAWTSGPLKEDRAGFELKLRPLLFRRKNPAIITTMVFVLCVMVYLASSFQKKTQGETVSGLTPIAQEMLIDFPQEIAEAIRAVDKLDLGDERGLTRFDEVSHRIQEKFERADYWKGLYYVALKWPESRSTLSEPLFGKIRQGEVWRILTPTFLHVGLIHILFNMLWLYALGRLIESRIGSLRYVVFIFVIGVLTNVLQYVVSGPLFMGYSGVVAAMAGYIWMRQKRAPWEGYPLPKIVFTFLFVFIVGLAAIQTVFFFLERFHVVDFQLGIANTAHVAGGLLGIACAKIPFFSKGIT